MESCRYRYRVYGPNVVLPDDGTVKYGVYRYDLNQSAAGRIDALTAVASANSMEELVLKAVTNGWETNMDPDVWGFENGDWKPICRISL